MHSSLTENFLRWRSIEATLALAQSPNAKVVVVGNSGTGGLPLIMDVGSDRNAPAIGGDAAHGGAATPPKPPGGSSAPAPSGAKPAAPAPEKASEVAPPSAIGTMNKPALPPRPLTSIGPPPLDLNYGSKLQSPLGDLSPNLGN